MRGLAHRLRMLSADEIRFRLLETGSIAREAVRVRRGVRRKRQDLAKVIDDRQSDLRSIRAALTANDFGTAHDELRLHFLTRPPRFPLDPSRRTVLSERIAQRLPDAAHEARIAGDRLLAGRVDLLGYRDLSFGPDPASPDWHVDPVHGRRAPLRFWRQVPYLDSAIGDHKIIWELNRHQHWLALGRASWLTGDPAYGRLFGAQLQSWLRANPPLVGVNWASMLELAFRAISWVWALHLFVPFEHLCEDPWLVDLLLDLDAHAGHIERHLSVYFSPNTHLLGEALALYVVGRSLPELKNAGRWEAIGRSVLLRETRGQVHPDGAHVEQSLHYHRYALDFYLLALAVARTTGDPAAAPFAETASRLATFCRALADDHGRLATIGDDDGGMLFPIRRLPPADATPSLAVAAALLNRPDLAIGPATEEVFWMTGGGVEPSGDSRVPPASILFPDAGYAVLRTRRLHAIMDVGPHGFLNGGHAHADALSLTLAVDGQPFLIDPGTGAYTIDPGIRDRFRSTALHNTVVLDGRNQSVTRGPFHWNTRTDARLVRWVTTESADYAQGEHDGYSPTRHRRTVLRIGDLILVEDRVSGTGQVPLTLHWHIQPDWEVSQSGDTLAATHPAGPSVVVASTGGPLSVVRAEERGVGWLAPIYGQVMPGCTLRQAMTATLPRSIVTAFLIDRSARTATLGLLPVDAVDDEPVTAVSLVQEGRVSVAIFRGGLDGPRPTARVEAAWGDVVTDARAAVLEVSSAGVPESFLMVDGSHASWTGPDGFKVSAPVADILQLNRAVLQQLSCK
jgi:hypothetical protein